MAGEIRGCFSHITSSSEVGGCWLWFSGLVSHVHVLRMTVEALVFNISIQGRKEEKPVKSAFLLLLSQSYPQQTQTRSLWLEFPTWTEHGRKGLVMCIKPAFLVSQRLLKWVEVVKNFLQIKSGLEAYLENLMEVEFFG